MATSYGLYTQQPEDWEPEDHTVKEEPNSPGSSDSQNSDSSPMSSQLNFSAYQSCYNTMTPMHYIQREELFNKQPTHAPFKVDDSLDSLMSMDRSDFIPAVPASDLERILALDGDPFLKKAESYKTMDRQRKQINSYPLPEVTPKDHIANQFPVQSFHFSFSSPQILQQTSQAMPIRHNADIIPCSPPQSGALHHSAPVNRLRFAKSKHIKRLAYSSPHSSDNGAPPPQKTKRGRTKHNKKYGHILWKFILELLLKPEHRNVIGWTGQALYFRIVNTRLLSEMWSKAKVRQHDVKISYDSITRALRSYKPKSKESKPAIISHSIESNFTYMFNHYYHQEISDEAGLQFSRLLEFARSHAIDASF